MTHAAPTQENTMDSTDSLFTLTRPGLTYLTGRIAQLAKRARKLGLLAPTITVLGSEWVEDHEHPGQLVHAHGEIGADGFPTINHGRGL
jgi:hypothetical protein